MPGDPRYQVRSTQYGYPVGGRMQPGEVPEDCFEAYRDGTNPSPNSYKTRAGKIGDRNEFELPDVLAQKCIETARNIRAIKRNDITNEKTCIACYPTRNMCPRGCQDLIDKLYSACEDVTMPDGWYFDPDGQLTGRWRYEIREQLKIEVE